MGLESLTSELDRKETAFQSLPQSELMKKRQTARGTGLPPSLTEALVAEKVLNDKAAAANAMTASMQSDPRTVAQQNEAQIRRQAEMEVAKAVGQANANKMQRQQKNMQKLASMDPRMLQRKGLAAAPVQRRQVMAQGGIVGYQDGGILDKLKDKRTGLYHPGPHMFDSLGQSAYDYVTKNPLEATGYGLLMLASRNPLVAAARRLGGTKLGKKGLNALGNLFTKQVPSFSKFPKNPKSISDLPPITKRVARPGRIAGAAGIGALAADKFLNPGDSTPVERELPESTYDEVPATPKATPSADADEARRREARRRFRYIAAGKSSSERLDREREYDQQKFTNKIEQDTLVAKRELNNINSVNVLQNRLTQVNAEIAALQEQLYMSPTNAALRDAEKKLREDSGNEELLETVRLLRLESAEELERYADPMGTGDVGLLVQRRQLQARVNDLQQGLMNDPMDSVVARNT